MGKCKLSDLWLGEWFKFKESDPYPFCVTGHSGGDVIVVRLQYKGPSALGNSITGESPEEEVIFVPWGPIIRHELPPTPDKTKVRDFWMWVCESEDWGNKIFTDAPVDEEGRGCDGKQWVDKKDLVKKVLGPISIECDW